MCPAEQELTQHTQAQDSSRLATSRPITAIQHWVTEYRCHFHFAAVVVALILARPTDLTDAWGLVPILAGLALRTWALGHLRRNTTLCTSGPYAYVRHPLYLGSFIILIGYCFMVNSLYVAVGAAIAAAVIYAFTVRREEQTLSVAYPEQFETYRQAVPLLLPRFTVYRFSSRKFSWRLALNNQVMLMWVLVLIVAALFEVKEDILEYLFGVTYSIIWPLWH